MKFFLSAVRRTLPLTLLALTVPWNPALAQNFDGKLVTAIEFDPPRQPLDNRDLGELQLVQTGKPLDAAQVAATIDRLYASGHYTDIKVDAEPTDGGVKLRFITKAQLFIGHLEVEGKISDPPSRGLLMSSAQLDLGKPFQPELLEKAKNNLQQSLRSNGLYESTVDVATTADPNTQQISVSIHVDAGKRAKYEMPEIHGDTKLPEQTIVRATGWKVRFVNRWRSVTESLTDKGIEGIRKKYQSKERLTAAVNLTSLEYDPTGNLVKPTLDINAGPKITVKALEAKISKGKLRQFVPVYQEGAVDRDLLTEGARNLHDYFQSRGYPDVDVTFKQLPPQADEQVINYYIARGPKRKLKHVGISGDSYFPEDTIRERLFLQPASFTLRNGRYSEGFRKKDQETIENLYRTNGFRDAKVTSSVQTNYKGKPNDLAANFYVREGPQWLVGKVTVVGSSELDLTQVLQRLNSVANQPYSDVNLTSDRSAILEAYFSNGFPEASFNYEIKPAKAPHTVDLTYKITEGRRVFVRSVLYSGLFRTKPRLVHGKVNMTPGEPLNLTKVSDTARTLSDLGVFARVNSAVQDSEGADRYKYVLYDFDEADRYTVNVGIGAEIAQIGATTSNLGNAGGNAGFSPRVEVDVNRLNFLGVGQTLSLQTRYSNIQQRAAINYAVPRFLGSENRTVTFSLLFDTTRDVTTFSSQREEASVQTSQRLTKASTILVRFAYRRVSTNDVVIPSLLVPQLLQAVRIGILSASYIQDHRDNAADAHHGYWNTVDAGVAGNFFGSQRNFGRILARNATYTSLTKNLVLARQTQLGVILPFDVPQGTSNADYVPLPERFFGGGGVSMRGFGYNQAGPRDTGMSGIAGTPDFSATGFPIGGNALFFNTVELRFPLLGANISGVAFHDWGNIYRGFSDLNLGFKQKNDTDFNYGVQAVGFGIRYRTPLGPVRVDLAYALNPPRYQGFDTGNAQNLLTCTGDQINATPECTSQPRRLSHFQYFFSIGQAF